MVAKPLVVVALLLAGCTSKPATPANTTATPVTQSEANAKVRPEEQASLMTTGMTQLTSGDNRNAADTFRKVLAINPTHYGASTLADAETAHAMTIHKSQGSEYEHVIVCLPDEKNRVLTRQLFYTGVTRGESRLTVIGSAAAVQKAIHSSVPRMSGLAYRLSHH